MKIVAYTDGACSGNPGPGGWGFLMKAFNNEGSMVKQLEMYGSEDHTTNNRMEIQAAIEVFKNIKVEGQEIQIFSDSKYLLDGIRKWIFGWKRKGWKTSAGRPVANAAQWQQLDLLAQDHKVIWTWVKGHNDNPGNIVADRLACTGKNEAFKRVADAGNKEKELVLVE